MIEDIIKKIITSEKRMAEEKGGFSLFGLFSESNLDGEWDVVASAPWIASKKQDDLIYIIENIKKKS